MKEWERRGHHKRPANRKDTRTSPIRKALGKERGAKEEVRGEYSVGGRGGRQKRRQGSKNDNRNQILQGRRALEGNP